MGLPDRVSAIGRDIRERESMRIHNLMEERVLDTANEMFDDEEARIRRTFCTCSQCRLDVACFVLNRIRPSYVVSGRGLAHMDMDYQEKLQREADVVSLVHQGVQQVSKYRRPDFRHQDERDDTVPTGFHYNFPQIVGRVFTSVKFERVSGVGVSLFLGSELKSMVNENWPNPYIIAEKTPGFYSFWPHPMQAEVEGDSKDFELEVSIDDPRYEPLRHYFHLALESVDGFRSHVQMNTTTTIEDLYLVPAEE